MLIDRITTYNKRHTLHLILSKAMYGSNASHYTQPPLLFSSMCGSFMVWEEGLVASLLGAVWLRETNAQSPQEAVSETVG